MLIRGVCMLFSKWRGRVQARQLGLWLILGWFGFVNIVFYWRLYQVRAGELSGMWQQFLGDLP